MSEPSWQFTITLPCKCGNAARYMNERGQFCCSVCPIKEGLDAIKLADVPKLLAWARKLDKHAETSLGFHAADVFELRDIIQSKPKPLGDWPQEDKS